MSTTFRLATLERLRGKDLEDRGRALSAATAALGEARTALAAVDEALNSGPAATTTPAELAVEGTYRDRLRAERFELVDEIARREAALEEARTAWLQARAQLKAVETLHERHRETRRAERARREQAELDDLAGSRRGRMPAQRRAAGDDARGGTGTTPRTVRAGGRADEGWGP